MNKPIANIRLDGDPRVVEAAKILLEHALGDLIHLGEVRESSRAKYAGTALCRGTLSVPTEDADLQQIEQQHIEAIRARQMIQATSGATVEVYARPECPFHYCDSPAECRVRALCRHVPLT